jgi:RHS repeat-associated protein
VALTSNSTGSVLECYAYNIYGTRTILAANGTTVRPTSSYTNNYGYTSREHLPESATMYYRARHYDPLSGEFLSRDPLEFVDGMSLYRGYFVPNGRDSSGTTVRTQDGPGVESRAGRSSGNCSRAVSIAVVSDGTTGFASRWNYLTHGCHVAIDKHNPNLDAALEKIKRCLGGCCISSITFAGHGSSSGMSPFILDNMKVDPQSNENKFLRGLGGLSFCPDHAGCEIRACRTGGGKDIMCLISNALGTKVVGWNDTYAVVPHGLEFTACPDGRYEQTGDTCMKYTGSYFEWANGGFTGPKPK